MYNALIYDSNFSPNIDLVDSTLTLHILIPVLHRVMEITESGSIDKLSQKFGVVIKDEITYNLSSLNMRYCLVDLSEDGQNATFLHFK